MSKIILNIKDIHGILVPNFKTHDTSIHKMHLQIQILSSPTVFPFCVSFKCNEVISIGVKQLPPSLPLFRMYTRACPSRTTMTLSLSLFLSRSCPFPLASLLFQVHATQLAIYVGYLCNGSSWLPARSTNTGIACTRQSHTKPDRNLYTALSATN